MTTISASAATAVAGTAADDVMHDGSDEVDLLDCATPATASHNADQHETGGSDNLAVSGVETHKINMLLAHPVVVRAMQNPRLDAILSRLLGVPY